MCNPYSNQVRFRKVDFEKIPQDAYGVYGIWFRLRCIYIGKAEKQPIPKRLEQHWRGTHNHKLKMWIDAKGRKLKVAFLIVQHNSQINVLERLYINKFQPLANELRYDELRT